MDDLSQIYAVLALEMARRHGVRPDMPINTSCSDDTTDTTQKTYAMHLIDAYIRPIIEDYLAITTQEKQTND